MLDQKTWAVQNHAHLLQSWQTLPCFHQLLYLFVFKVELFWFHAPLFFIYAKHSAYTLPMPHLGFELESKVASVRPA